MNATVGPLYLLENVIAFQNNHINVKQIHFSFHSVSKTVKKYISYYVLILT